MSGLVRSIFDGMIEYAFLGTLLAVFLMLILLIVLSARNLMMGFLRIEALRIMFERLCEFSDRLDENHVAENPYCNAVWLTRIIWTTSFFCVGLMILWMLIKTV
jgi:hypothetical protein